MARTAVAIALSLALLAAATSPAAAQASDGDPSPLSGQQGPDVAEGLPPGSLGPDGLLDPDLGDGSLAAGVAYPNLGSQLSALAVASAAASDSGGESALGGAALPGGTSSALDGEPLLLTVELEGNRTGVVDFFADNGVAPSNVVGDYLEVYVPPELLGALAQQTGVLRVRETPQPFKNVTSPTVRALTAETVRDHGAEAWHKNGFTGDGVKVGVLDTASTVTAKDGFTGLRALRGTELPSTVVGRCYTDVGAPTSDLANCDTAGGDRHGTLVAGSLMDIAPDAELYVSNPRTWADLQSAVEWMHGQGVTVIVYSVSWSYHGPADGTSPITPSPLNTAKWAADNGIIWVNAAGNRARTAWYGAFADSDDDGYHEWAGTGSSADEAQMLWLQASRSIYVNMRWDDVWGGSTKDLDIEFRYSATIDGAQSVVATAADPQNGGTKDYPWEGLRLTAAKTGYYWVHVKKKAASAAPSWVQFIVFGHRQIDHYTAGGTVTSPADSSSSGVLAVGAADKEQDGTFAIEGYSSRGPAPDGRTKPDIVGLTCRPALGLQAWMCGTSQSAPFVAGLAALVRERYPAYTPQQVADYLKTNAADHGAAGADNTWGHGLALLPSDGLTPLISVSGGAGVVEGSAAEFTLTADPKPSAGLPVTVSVAQVGDFGAAGTRTVTVPVSGNVTFSVATTHDAVVEPDGSVAVTVEAGAGYFPSSASSATVAVADNKYVVGISANGDVTEGAAAGFTLSVSPVPSVDVPVAVTVVDSGAFAVSGDVGARTVTVPAGAATAALAVGIVNDAVNEGDGSITATLDAPAGGEWAVYKVDSNAESATVAVADDDGALPVDLSLSVDDTTVSEDDGQTVLSISLSRKLRAAETVRIPITISGGPINESWNLDNAPYMGRAVYRTAYGAESEVTIGTGGQVAKLVFSGRADADRVHTPITIAFEWSTRKVSTSSISEGVALGGPVTIVVQETPEVSVNGGSGVTEGTAASFTVSAAPAPAADLSVNVLVSASGDFGVATGTRSVTVPTSGSATFSVATTGDSVAEPAGFAAATLMGGSGYTVSSSQNSSIVTVYDDNTVPVVSVAADGDVVEGASADFTVSAIPAPASDLPVSVTVTADGDYGATTGTRTVTIPTSGSVTLTIATSDDSTDETDGSITATANTGSGYTVSPSHGAGTVAVADNDDPPVGPVLDAQLEADVRGYAAETHHGALHVTRWKRVLEAFGLEDYAGLEPTTLDEATVHVDIGRPRWVPVLAHMAALDAVDPQPPPARGNVPVDAQVLATARSRAAETHGGEKHVNRWKRVLEAFGDGDYPDLEPLTAAGAQVYANVWSGWDEVAAQLRLIEAAGTTTDPPPVVIPPTPEVGISGSAGGSEGATVTFTLTASPAPAADLDVDVSVATTGDFGYGPIPASVTIPAGGTATVSITTADDSTDEPDGTVTLTINTGSGYTVSATQWTGTVDVSDDDDAPPNGPMLDAQLEADVRGYAAETHHGALHVTRWKRVLEAFGLEDYAGLEATTLDEARVHVDIGRPRWVPVLAHMAAVDAVSPQPVPARGSVQVDAQLLATARAKAGETHRGAGHVNRWKRVLEAFGDGDYPGVEPLTAAGAQVYANVWSGWDGVAAQIRLIEAAAGTVPPPVIPPVVVAPTPEVNITGSAGGAEGATVTFTLTASPAPAADLVVDVSVVTAGDFGYGPIPATVTIPVGGTATVTIATTGDSADEPDGTVALTIGAGSGYTVGAHGSDSVDVTDDDVPVAPVVVPDPVVSIAAGPGVTEGGSASFTLTASPAPAADLPVSVTVAAAGDYGAATGPRTVTVPTGGSVSFTVATSDDSTDEPDGSVTATVDAGSGYTVSATQGAGTVAVADNDVPIPVVSITAGTDVTEGADVTFTLTASPAPAAGLPVTVTVAQSGDFGAATGSRTVTVPTGGSVSFTVATSDDSTDETDGSVTATVGAGSGYTVSATQGAGTVGVADDDDPPPSSSVTVSVGDATGSEAGGVVEFTVSLSEASGEQVRVWFSTWNWRGLSGRAKMWLDYWTVQQTVVFAPGQTEWTVSVWLVDDSRPEPDEYFTVTLTNPRGATIEEGKGAATGTITDDD